MRTLTRLLKPHARTAWLVFSVFSVLAVGIAITVVLVSGGGRVGAVATAFTGLVAVVVLAACLDAILVPGNPDLRSQTRPGAGWAAAMGVGGWSDGGGSGGGGGDGGGSCG